MKTFIATLFSLAVLSAMSAKDEKWSIGQADRIVVAGQRVFDQDSPPAKITDPQLVSQIVGLVREAKGRWKKGWATAPAGDIRFIFYRGDQYLDAVGVGDRFLVRGGGSDWESKQITSELEARLRSFLETKKPNQASEPTATSGRGSP